MKFKDMLKRVGTRGHVVIYAPECGMDGNTANHAEVPLGSACKACGATGLLCVRFQAYRAEAMYCYSMLLCPECDEVFES